MTARQPVALVGLHGGLWWGEQAGAALRQADVLVGSADQRADLLAADLQGEWIELWGKGRVDEIVDTCEQRAATGAKVCLLTSGDPGFFGLLERMADRLGRDGIVVHPAPTSVALAFARLVVPWDDATVVVCGWLCLACSPVGPPRPW
jgi:precorrin-6Y C5,15-methyltransferase (decarboxylating)